MVGFVPWHSARRECGTVDDTDSRTKREVPALTSVVFRPFLCGLIIFCPVVLEKSCGFRFQRIFRVWVCQHCFQGFQYITRVQRWSPVFVQQIRTNITLFIDVRVVNFCQELDSWRLERIFRRKDEVHVEYAPFIRGGRRAHKHSIPVQQVITAWSRSSKVCGICFQVGQLLS